MCSVMYFIWCHRSDETSLNFVRDVTWTLGLTFTDNLVFLSVISSSEVTKNKIVVYKFRAVNVYVRIRFGF